MIRKNSLKKSFHLLTPGLLCNIRGRKCNTILTITSKNSTAFSHGLHIPALAQPLHSSPSQMPSSTFVCHVTRSTCEPETGARYTSSSQASQLKRTLIKSLLLNIIQHFKVEGMRAESGRVSD